MSIRREKAYSGQGYIDMELDYLRNLINENPNHHFIGIEKLTIKKVEAIGIHYKSNSEEYGAIEVIDIVLPSKNKDEFYHLEASASRTDKFKLHMAIMIQSLITFKESKETCHNK